jgi:hypothetical protein
MTADAKLLADRIEKAIDPQDCNYAPGGEHGVPRIIVNLLASEWRTVIKALRGDLYVPEPWPPASEAVKDVARLDWLEQRQISWRNTISDMHGWFGADRQPVRAAIDAAMNEQTDISGGD